MIKVSDIKGFSENAIQREVAQALRRLAIHGEPMNSTASVKLMVMIDQETLKGMPSGLSKSEQAKWLAGSLRTAEDIEALNLSAWKERINLDIPASTASGGARVAKAVPFVGNLVAGFVQVALGVSLYQQLGAAKWENGSRLLGTVSLFAATLADTAEKSAEDSRKFQAVSGTRCLYGNLGDSGCHCRQGIRDRGRGDRRAVGSV